MKSFRHMLRCCLVLLLLLACTPLAQAQEVSAPHFSEITYSRPDLAEFSAQAAEIRALLPKASQAPTVATRFAELEELYLDFLTQAQLAALYNSLDITDAYFSEEAVSSYLLLVEAQNMLVELAQAILASPCGRAVAATWQPQMRAYYSYSSTSTPEQIALISREQELLQQYLQLSQEEVAVDFNGQQLTYTEAAASIYRQADWQAYLELYYQANNARLGALFLELRDLRNQLAQSYGFESYLDYAYLAAYQRSYSPAQVQQLLTELTGSMQELYSLMLMAQDYDALDSYHLSLEELTLEELALLLQPHFGEVSEELAASYAFMLEYGFYDFTDAPTKDEGAYVTFLTGYGVPFLVIRPEYAAYDLTTLIHESGHYYNYYHNAESFQSILVSDNLDLAETHARSLEALFVELAAEIMEEPEQVYGMRYYGLTSMFYALLDAALIGNFEIIAYENPDYTLAQLNQAMYELSASYDSAFLPAAQYRYSWTDYPHLFQAPLYYISYSSSTLAALELWTIAAADWPAAREIYENLIANGASDDFTQALLDSGLSDPFQAGHLTALTAAAQALLQEYGMLYYYEDMSDHWASLYVAQAHYYGILSHHVPPFDPDELPDGMELLGYLGSISSYGGDEYGFRAAVRELEEFEYDQPLSRQAFLFLLYSMEEEPSTDNLDQPAFADWAEVAPWAQEAVSYLNATGVLTGGAGGLLSPTRPINRAEAIVLLVRYLQS